MQPGEQSLLFNLSRVEDKNKPQVLATAARVYDEKIEGKTYSFICKSPINTNNSMRILLSSKPTQAKVSDSIGNVITDVQSSWDASSKTLYLGFANNPDGIKVSIE